jgi:hypothetical protein
MIEHKIIFEIIAYAFKILAVLVGGYVVFERLLGNQIFLAFRRLTPKILSKAYPADISMKWYETFRAKNQESYHWSVIFDFGLSTATFCILMGCWVFLGLMLGEIFNIGIFWITVWFIAVTVQHIVASIWVNWLKIHVEQKVPPEKMSEYVFSNQKEVARKWLWVFLKNWIEAPIVAFKIVLLSLLSIILHLPAWILRIKIGNTKIRHFYYVVYALSAAALGQTISFVIIILQR